MIAQLVGDWTLIGLVVCAVAAFAALACGVTGRLPFSFEIRPSSMPLWPDGRSDARTQAQADLRQRLASALETSERRRLDAAINVVEFRRRSW